MLASAPSYLFFVPATLHLSLQSDDDSHETLVSSVFLKCLHSTSFLVEVKSCTDGQGGNRGSLDEYKAWEEENIILPPPPSLGCGH